MHTVLAVLARLFVALALFLVAAIVGRTILRNMPHGRTRSLLARRIEIVPTVPVTPRVRATATVLLALVAGWSVGVQLLRAAGWLS